MAAQKPRIVQRDHHRGDTAEPGQRSEIEISGMKVMTMND